MPDSNSVYPHDHGRLPASAPSEPERLKELVSKFMREMDYHYGLHVGTVLNEHVLKDVAAQLTDLLDRLSADAQQARDEQISAVNFALRCEAESKQAREECAMLCDHEADKRLAQSEKAEAGCWDWGEPTAAMMAQMHKAITARGLATAIRALNPTPPALNAGEKKS